MFVLAGIPLSLFKYMKPLDRHVHRKCVAGCAVGFLQATKQSTSVQAACRIAHGTTLHRPRQPTLLMYLSKAACASGPSRVTSWHRLRTLKSCKYSPSHAPFLQAESIQFAVDRHPPKL